MKALIGLIMGSSVVFAIVFAALFVIGALLWPYSINSWLIYAGKEPVMEWWMGGLMGMVPGIGQASVPAAFITFVLMLFIGAAAG